MSTARRSALALLIGIAIFAGLPLVGWGLADIQGFAGNPARLGFLVLVILLEFFIMIKFPGVGRTGATGTKIVRRQQFAVLLLQVIPLAIVILAPYGDRRNIAVLGESENVRYVGLILFALGFSMVSWAEASLGKLFSVQVTIQKDHRLVTDGLYHYLRHPRYLGIILFTAGIALVFRSWLAVLLVAALTLVLLWRIHDEETFMHQEFGTEWEAYSKRSWRLIPRMY